MSRLSARKSDRVARQRARTGHRLKDNRKHGKSRKSHSPWKLQFLCRLPWYSLGILVTLLIVSAGTLNIWSSGRIFGVIDEMRLTVLETSVEAGLAIDEVYVEGRQRAPSGEIRSALGVARGDPILGVDAAAAKARLEALGWIAKATVERRLPDTLYVRIVERRPTALWQHNGKLNVVDMNGAVITGTDVGRFAHLPQIVGSGAARELPALLKVLARDPALSARISAAVWVGDRRWNLRFDDRIDVKMPEGSLAPVWQRLIELQQRVRVLDTDIVALDLRQSDRVVVRLHPDAATAGSDGSDA